jgi:hypothetical protein
MLLPSCGTHQGTHHDGIAKGVPAAVPAVGARLAAAAATAVSLSRSLSLSTGRPLAGAPPSAASSGTHTYIAQQVQVRSAPVSRQHDACRLHGC